MKRNALFFILLVFVFPLYSQDSKDNLDKSNSLESYYIENAMDFTIAGDNENAIKQLDRAIETNPKFTSAFIMRGDIKSQMKDYKGAMDDYDRAIDINPGDPEAYKSRGNVKVKLEDFTGAINDYTLAIEKNANDAEAYNFRGIAMATAGNYDGAIKDYNNALELNPKYSEAFANKADAKIHLGKYFDAIKDCNFAIQFSGLAFAYYLRGLAKANLSDKMGGCMDMSKSGELGYQDAYIMIKKYCQ